MNFEKLSKKELLDIATKKKIAGRSKMTKPQLIEALEPLFSPKQTTSSSHQQGYMPAPAAPIKHMPKKDEYPIPDYYNIDTLVLLPVDPSKEYVYWEVSDMTLNSIKSELRLSHGRLTLKVFSQADGSVYEAASVAVERIGNWYFNIYAPDITLWSELGFVDSNGAFHRILRSNIIKMPSDKVSDIAGDESWMTRSGDLEKLYHLSGVGKHDHMSSVNIHTDLAKQLSQHIASSGFMKDK